MLGHSVVLVEKARFPRAHIGESLTGGVLPLLEVLRLRNEVEQAGFLRNTNALIRWGGAAEYRDTIGEPGFQVDRSQFDAILLAGARAAGVRIFQPGKALDIAARPGQGSTVVLRHPEGDATVDCDFLVDATGRASIVGGCKRPVGSSAIALYAYWKDGAIGGTETRVEAGPCGWFWGAPLPGGLFNATVFLENRAYKQGVAEAGSLDRLYGRLIGSSELLKGCLAGALVGRVAVCSATCFFDDDLIRNRLLKTGDSAFTIDPLSSQGVQTAIGSALHAAAVIHTMLERPWNSALAEDFYRQRLRRSFAFHATAAAALYAEAASVFGTDFWRRWSAWERPPEPETYRPPVRLSPGTVVCVHPSVSFHRVPIIEGAFVGATLGVVLPTLSEPAVFLADVLLAPLIRALEGPMRCDLVLERWATLVPPQKSAQILAAAVRQGILRVENVAGL